MEDTQKKETKKKKIADMISKHPYTVMELNYICNTTESRKRISELKAEGKNVKSKIINHKNGTKQYWIEND